MPERSISGMSSDDTSVSHTDTDVSADAARARTRVATPHLAQTLQHSIDNGTRLTMPDAIGDAVPCHHFGRNNAPRHRATPASAAAAASCARILRRTSVVISTRPPRCGDP